MAGRARAGAEEEETGEVISVGFAGKAKKVVDHTAGHTFK